MISNYFKIAIAVLKRRKFFTFISLFGISFTLAILMVLTSFKDFMISASYPETKRDQCLYINRIVQKNVKEGYTMSSEASYSFLEKYAATLKTPAKVAISSLAKPASAYQKNHKLELDLKYANAAYWDVMEYDFVQGKPFTQQQINNAENVVVISDDARRQYFGDDPNVIGKYIEANNIRYRVMGVVQNVPKTMMYSAADLIVPYTTERSNYKNPSYGGNYVAILLAKSKSDVAQMEQEFQSVIARVKPEDPKSFNQLYIHADPYLESYTRAIFGNATSTGIGFLYLVISIIVFLFLLLPTINLVNINISRIMERSSEIGVRKAFGASSGTLVIQFIFENLILTLLGGIIGVVIALLVISLVNHSELIPNGNLSLNYRVLFTSLLLCLLFGLISGVLPAWRMSRMQVIRALKATP